MISPIGLPIFTGVIKRKSLFVRLNATNRESALSLRNHWFELRSIFVFNSRTIYRKGHITSATMK